MYSSIHEVGSQSLPSMSICFEVTPTKFVLFSPCHYIPNTTLSCNTKCKFIALPLSKSGSNGKTFTDLMATEYSLSFNNLRKIICEFTYFIFLFFLFLILKNLVSFRYTETSMSSKADFLWSAIKATHRLSYWVSFLLNLNFFKFERTYMWSNLQIHMSKFKVFAWQVTYVSFLYHFVLVTRIKISLSGKNYTFRYYWLLIEINANTLHWSVGSNGEVHCNR